MVAAELIALLQQVQPDANVVPIIYHDGAGRQGALFEAVIDEDGDVLLSIED